MNYFDARLRSSSMLLLQHDSLIREIQRNVQEVVDGTQLPSLARPTSARDCSQGYILQWIASPTLHVTIVGEWGLYSTDGGAPHAELRLTWICSQVTEGSANATVRETLRVGEPVPDTVIAFFKAQSDSFANIKSDIEVLPPSGLDSKRLVASVQARLLHFLDLRTRIAREAQRLLAIISAAGMPDNPKVLLHDDGNELHLEWRLYKQPRDSLFRIAVYVLPDERLQVSWNGYANQNNVLFIDAGSQRLHLVTSEFGESIPDKVEQFILKNKDAFHP